MLVRLTCFALLAATAAAQNNALVSASSSGTLANDDSYYSLISSDGRYVVFQSEASNLVSNDFNGQYDIFRHDLQTGATELVSVGLSGNSANGLGLSPAVSGDGRLVAWSSNAGNLVAGDTNGTWDVFLRDMVTGVTTRISLTGAGAQAPQRSDQPRITPDGRYVTFESDADLIPADTNGVKDCYRLDRSTGALDLVSTSSSGGLGNSISYAAQPSDDGRYACFFSTASNLVAGDTNGQGDVFWKDLQTGTCLRVNVSTGGAESNSESIWPSLSGDGQTVTFCSRGSNLVAGDTNSNWDLFAHDVPSGVTTRLNLQPGGAQADSYTRSPSALTQDGRFVVYASLSTNLVPGDTNGAQDIFVRDRQLQTTERVSLGHLGDQTNSDNFVPHITPDGSVLTFTSTASNIVPGDTNGRRDIFATALVPDSGPGTPYCLGDGSDGTCPCGNLGSAGEGCANSSGAGATLAGGGVASLSNDSFALTAAGVPGAKPGLVIRGANQITALLSGDGLLCTGGQTARSQVQITSAGGTVFNDFQGAGFGASSYGAGVPTNYQFWYRDPQLSPCAGGFNFSNGVSVVWVP